MIKILPTGTSAVLKCGLKPVRSHKSHGRLGDGAKEHKFELDQVLLNAKWRDNRIEAVLETNFELYIRSITLEFHFRSPRHSGETTLWTEVFADEFISGALKSAPGIFSQKSGRDGAWAFWLSEASDAEGLFFRQSPPIEYPIRFHCKPGSRVLNITWDINRLFGAGENLVLPVVGMSRGRIDTLDKTWRREWKNASHREILQDRRVGWCGGNEIQAPKDLREILASIRTRKIKMDWFAVGPNYASEIGDWLLPSESFKDRMGSLSRTIGEQNIIPALRFAPLLVSKKSTIAAEHRDWLVKAHNSTPVTVPGYSKERDSLYVLDITIPEVVKHIKRTFSLMKDQWGFRAYYLERIGDSSIRGVRSNNSKDECSLLKIAASAIREVLGNKVLIIASGLPLLAVSDTWDARVMAPEINLIEGFSTRKKRRRIMSVTSALLHRSSWNQISWVNASGILPLNLFKRDCDSLTLSLKSAVILSSGMITFTGDTRNLDDETRDSIMEFTELFKQCRKGRLRIAPNIGGGRYEPLVVRNDTGWIGLFNMSERKKEVRLDQEKLKSSLGVSSPISAGTQTVFNSPEIHVALPPMGHRLFRG